MAQIFGLKELQERKRALVAESEIYRQTLRLEVQNIRLYGLRVQRQMALLRLLNPVLLLAGSALGGRLFGRKAGGRRRTKWSVLGLGLMAWRLYRNYGPMLLKIFGPRMAGERGPRPGASETAKESTAR